MRLTDYALAFVVIILPIVLIVYINTSFVLRAEREELYYKNLVNTAISDATSAMKIVENEDNEIDYGYSGLKDNKVSVNADIAVNTFFDSLFNNLGIKGNANSENVLRTYVPAIGVIDYNGISIYSAEEDNEGNISYVVKPKKYFTYTYYIQRTGSSPSYSYSVQEYNESVNINKIHAHVIYQVTFTQDDYVYLKVYHIEDDNTLKDVADSGIEYINAFYLNDNDNNTWLVGSSYALYNKFSGSLLTEEANDLKDKVVELLNAQRKQVIAKVCMQELSYAVNAHNYFAQKAGVKYNFNFSIESDQDWYETVDGIGMVAVVQGISLGNRYLNYNAYSMSDLSLTKKYYISDVTKKTKEDDTSVSEVVLGLKYYHISENCPVYKKYLAAVENESAGDGYKYYLINGNKALTPSYFINKEEAAANGFHPCYVCRP